jgi:hypothetical protein
MYENPRILQPYDYLEYWSAARALLNGQNPYDGGVLFPLQQGITAWDEPIMMWNPPWVLPLVAPLGALHWRTGQLLWLAFNLSAVLASAFWLWRLFAGTRSAPALAFAASLLFAPTLFLLLLGQINGFMLLGLVGFVWFLQRDRAWLAGTLAALTAIKPHLLAPFALVLVLEACRNSRTRKAVLTGAAVIAVCAALPLLVNPDIWSQYLQATSTSSANTHHTLSDWEHPTLGYALRQAIPNRPFAAMFIPLAIVLPLVAGYWWKRRVNWNWSRELPRLTLVSLLAAPYGAWGNDLVLLLPAVLQAAAWLAADRRVWLQVKWAGIFFVLNLALLSTVTREHSMSNPWIAPATAAGYLLVGWSTRQQSSSELARIPQPQPV